MECPISSERGVNDWVGTFRNLNFCQISNFLGVFPVCLAIKFKLYWIAIAMAIASICSIVYHHDEHNDNALYADLFGCALLCATFFYIFFNINTIPNIVNILAFVYASAALTFYYMAGLPKEPGYETFHTAWHVFAIYAFTLFIYTYINLQVLEQQTPLTRTISITVPESLKNKFKFIPIPIRNWE